MRSDGGVLTPSRPNPCRIQSPRRRILRIPIANFCGRRRWLFTLLTGFRAKVGVPLTVAYCTGKSHARQLKGERLRCDDFQPDLAAERGSRA